MAYFKVVIESLMDAKSWGDIAVDDIKVLNGLSMAECKGEAFSFTIYTSWIAHVPNFVSSLSYRLYNLTLCLDRSRHTPRANAARGSPQ